MSVIGEIPQCKHCEKVFFNQSLWQEHYDWHTTIQLQLGRPARRRAAKGNAQGSGNVEQVTDLISRIELRGDSTKGVHRPEAPTDESNPLPSDTQMERYLQKAIADFPPYEGGGIDKAMNQPTIKCPDCKFHFYTQEQRDEHYLSKYCKGNQISLYIMTIDSSNIGGYRVIQEDVPFESKAALFACKKCDDAFATDAERMQHESSHPVEQYKCLHCDKALQSQYELEEHYRWHDDLHLRQHIDQCIERMKEQGRGQQTHQVTGTDHPQRLRNPWNRRDDLPRHDGDVVAISFVSREDLEMQYAPDGVLNVSRENFHSLPENSIPLKVGDPTAQTKRSFRKSLKGLFRGGTGETSSTPSREAKRASLNIPGTGPGQGIRGTQAKGYIECQLYYSINRSGWVLTYNTGLPSEFHATSVRLAFKNSQQIHPGRSTAQKCFTEFETILGQIADYAISNYVEDMAGLESITANLDAPGGVTTFHVRSLQAWFDRQKQNTLTNSKPRSLRGLPILGYGSSSRIFVRDTLGRSRLITGKELNNIVPGAIGPPRGCLDAIRMALSRRGEAALARGNREAAGQIFTKLSPAITALYGDEQTRFILLMHLATNIYKGAYPSKSAAAYMAGLRCSQKLYGMDSVNNFTTMTNLAIYYENIGRLDDAIALYHRSMRGRINTNQKEDALMNAQELGRVFQKLGKSNEALQFLEEAYAGHLQVVGPDHRMTLLVLNNLVALYCSIDSAHKVSLLKPAIPLMEKVLGPEDPVTWGALCNFLMYSDDSNFPPAVMEVIDRYMARNTSPSLTVRKALGDHYGKNGMIRKAMETYRSLYAGRVAVLGPSHPETLDSLYSYAYALERLGEVGESLKQYGLLVSQQGAQSSLAPTKLQASRQAIQYLTSKQNALEKERVDWGLTVAQKCTVDICNSQTLRFCSVCKLARFCSLACQMEDVGHSCIPSVTLSESTFTLVKDPLDQSSVTRDAEFLFTQMRLLQRPRCVSAKDVFIDPKNFATIRVSKNPANMLSIRVNPNLDLRFGLVPSNLFQWATPEQSSMICALNGVEDTFILVTPGQSMMPGLVAHRDKTFGIESDELAIPGKDLIEYAQTGVAERNEGLYLGFVLMEWAL